MSSDLHSFATSRAAKAPGRQFVCGDIHGCYDELLAKLDELRFDKNRDALFALGDLVDRGPKSAEVMALLDKPWFASIAGNHEVMMIAAEVGDDTMHLRNGGEWFAELDRSERARLADRARTLPVALVVTTNSGRRVGLVHADIPFKDWAAFMRHIDDPAVRQCALWSRTRTQKIEAGRMPAPIKNIDHVYFGHTPFEEPLHVANISWIDTACYRSGQITIEELI